MPFEIVPYKSNRAGTPPAPVKRQRVHAIPAKSDYKITFPRVEGYTQAIRNRITVNWASVPALVIDPLRIPPEVEMKASLPTNRGRPSLLGPGRIEAVTLNPYRSQSRMQQLVFEMARALTRDLVAQPNCTVPTHVLFPQLVRVIERYLDEKVEVHPPANIKDVWLSPWYGLAIEGLTNAIRPDTSEGETPEVPRYESSRGPGSTADVDFFTKRDVYPIVHSHVNYVVADTDRWEQSAAYFIDTHPATTAFVKNVGLGFAIPYIHNGQLHDYQPDFLIRLKSDALQHIILETKGYDPLADVKRAAAERWVAAVNADGRFGEWHYRLVRRPVETSTCITSVANTISKM